MRVAAVFQIAPVAFAGYPSLEHRRSCRIAERDVLRSRGVRHARGPQPVERALPIRVGVAEEITAYHVLGMRLRDGSRQPVPTERPTSGAGAVRVGQPLVVPYRTFGRDLRSWFRLRQR